MSAGGDDRAGDDPADAAAGTDGDSTASEPTADGDSIGSGADSSADGVSRRTLVRLLIAVAIGIPVAIEVGTLLGMLGGDGGDERVGIGDELLPATPQTETVADSSVTVSEVWIFELVVEVTNGADGPYELVLGPVRTDRSDPVGGTRTTGEVPAGTTTTLRADWEIPAASSPTAVDAVATWGDERVEERVEIESPPVYHE